MTLAMAERTNKRGTRAHAKTVAMTVGLVTVAGSLVAIARSSLRAIIGGYEPELVAATWNSDAQSPEPAVFWIVGFVGLLVLIGVVVLAVSGRRPHPDLVPLSAAAE